jgi:hypothetical protein
VAAASVAPASGSAGAVDSDSFRSDIADSDSAAILAARPFWCFHTRLAIQATISTPTTIPKTASYFVAVW